MTSKNRLILAASIALGGLALVGCETPNPGADTDNLPDKSINANGGMSTGAGQTSTGSGTNTGTGVQRFPGSVDSGGMNTNTPGGAGTSGNTGGTGGTGGGGR